jgi:hypothetical protein
MEMSGKSKLAIAAVAVLVAVPAGVVLADGLGAEPSPGQTRVPGIESAAVHAAAAGPGAIAAPKAGGGGGHHKKSAALRYFLTKGLSVPAGRSGLKVGPLPKGCHPINGYYFVRHQLRTKVISEGDSLYGHRQWAFYRNNPTGGTVKHVVYGVVCIRGVRVVH